MEGGLRHVRLNRPVAAVVAVLVVAALVTGVLTGTFGTLARSGLYGSRLLSHAGATTLPPGALSAAAPSSTTSEAVPGGGPSAVMVPVSTGSSVSARKVAARIRAVGDTGLSGTVSATVVDAGTGHVLYARNATQAYLPASTLKLLTTTAALSILGPQRRFTTQVVSAGPLTSARGRIVLVGGGDPYLLTAASRTDPDRASIVRLAQLTAARLKKSGITRVQLGYDTSLFTGPAWNPDWPAKYADQVSPVSALWVREGRVRGASGPRVTDPARTAAQAFATALAGAGVHVASVKRATAPAKAPRLAAMQSMPLQQIVEQLLRSSDNDAAEVVARQAALGAGRPGSVAGAQTAVRARLRTLGLWTAGTRVRDGSGLARSDRVPAAVMADLLRLDLSAAHPELRAVITGLPVAGVEGSLKSRFAVGATRAVRGMVHAKTGTLTGVHALAGYLRTADGSLMVYAFLVNGSTDYFGPRAWLDRVVDAVGTCGCR